MKIHYLRCLLLVVTVQICGEASVAFATTGPSQAAKIVYRKFYGTLAGQPVVMDLTQSDNQIQGTYYYDKIGSPLSLSGSIAADNSFKLIEMYNGSETGKWVGRWSSEGVSGKFTSVRSGKSFDFNLTDYQGSAARITFESREKEDCSVAERRKKDPDTAEEDHSCSTIKVELMKVSLPSPQAASAINRAIFRKTCTNDGPVTSLDGYLATVFNPEDDFITQMGSSSSVHTNDDGMLCVSVLRWELQEGAAHGMSEIQKLNFDLATGRLIALDDLFKAGYRPALTPIVKRLFEAENGKIDLEYNSEGFKLSNEFAIQRNGILFQYGYYEIGPYAMGPPSVLVPWKEIRQLLRPGAIPAKWLPQQ